MRSISVCKDSANWVQYKTSLLVFIAEVPPILREAKVQTECNTMNKFAWMLCYTDNYLKVPDLVLAGWKPNEFHSPRQRLGYPVDCVVTPCKGKSTNTLSLLLPLQGVSLPLNSYPRLCLGLWISLGFQPAHPKSKTLVTILQKTDESMFHPMKFPSLHVRYTVCKWASCRLKMYILSSYTGRW